MNDRRTLEDEVERNFIKSVWFWTANFAMYTVVDNEELLYLGGRETNPTLKNMEKAVPQLLKVGHPNYRPNLEDIQEVVYSEESGNTVKVKLLDLELIGERYKERHFEINTSDYANTLNKSERALAEKVYGQGDDFGKNMGMLRENNVGEATIDLLSPKYVRNQVKEGGAIVRPCTLWNLEFGFRFDAVSRFGVIGPAHFLRGVPKRNAKFNEL